MEFGAEGMFGGLQVLSLARNNLTGRIPEEWAWSGGFQAVVEFDLSYNQLTGARACMGRRHGWEGGDDAREAAAVGCSRRPCLAIPKPCCCCRAAGPFPAVAYTNTSFFKMQSL